MARFDARKGGLHWSIASRIFAAQLLAVALLSGCLTLLLWLDSRASADDDAARLSLAVTTTLAHDPFVISAVQTADPSEVLQPYAVKVMDSAGLDFVTIMDTDGTRFTHRNPDEIGKTFLGTTDAALRGETLTETFTGTLGPSVRAVVPVMDGGEVVAIVSAGVTVSNVVASLGPRIPFVIGAAALLVGVGSAGAFLARRFLSRLTGSMRPSELSRMVSYYESILHSVREGLVLTDAGGRVVLYNDEAAELLDLPPAAGDARPVPVSDLDLPPSLALLIEGAGRAVDESHVAGHRILVVNQQPATRPGGTTGRALGTLTTLRDRTEVNKLAGELESVRTLSDALRSQTHEHANRLHTVVSLLELGRSQEAIDLIAQEVELSQALADDVVGAINEPVLSALLLGKAAQAKERGIDLRLGVDDELPPSNLSPSELVSVVGNLIDNAMDAAVDGPAPGWVSLTVMLDAETGMLELTVADSGRGIDPAIADEIFSRGVSTKSADVAGRGYGLAVVREILGRRGGSIELSQRTGTEFVVRVPVGRGRL
jgi:two-component system, CitB family, sensor kinase